MPKVSEIPCFRHGENPRRYPCGICVECSKEARVRYKARYIDKHGEAGWKERQRRLNNAAYADHSSKTYLARSQFLKKMRYSRPEQYMLWNTKSAARKRGWDFNITVEDLTVPAVCPVLGIPLQFTLGKQTPNTPSVDRIDSTKGYIKGNVLVVSLKANRIKMNSTPDELITVGEFYRNLTRIKLAA